MLILLRILLFLSIFQVMYALLSGEADSICSGLKYSNLCVKLGSKYYLLDASAQLNWIDADRFCRRQNANLVTIQNSNELKLISEYLLSKDYDLGDHHFWTSGNDLGSKGVFYSVATGDVLPFVAWISTQPDSHAEKENCVILWRKPKRFEMNVADCNSRLNFICELKDVKFYK